MENKCYANKRSSEGLSDRKQLSLVRITEAVLTVRAVGYININEIISLGGLRKMIKFLEKVQKAVGVVRDLLIVVLCGLGMFWCYKIFCWAM